MVMAEAVSRKQPIISRKILISLGNREIRMQVNALDVMQNNKVEEGQEVGLRFLQPRYYEARKEDHDESA